MAAVHSSLEHLTQDPFAALEVPTTPLESSISFASLFSWLWKSEQPRFSKLTDIEYPSLTGVQSEKNKLDIYIPKNSASGTLGAPKLPVLIHIHGGGWVRGDKAHWFYGSPSMGAAFASFNFITVAIGYRTKVPFPGAIQDVADAIAWVHQHIGEEQYGGGDTSRVFLSGHSAGGHLASLVTLDRQWLERRDVPADFIKGVVSISGIYHVPEPMESPVMVWGYNKLYIQPTFGDNLEFMLSCSPLTHIKRLNSTVPHNTPPFLVINAERDFGLERDGRAFADVFTTKGLPCRYEVLLNESHGSVSRSQSTMVLARDFLVSLLANLSTQVPAVAL